MSIFRKQVFKLEFKQIAALMFGTLFGQIVTFMASPILSRLYSPQEFGLFGTFIAAVTIVSSISSLRFDIAISLPEDIRESIAVALAGLISSIAFSVVTLVFLVLFRDKLSSFFGSSNSLYFLLVAPAYVLVVSTNQLCSQLNLRKSEYVLQAKIRTFQSLLTAGLSIVFSGAGIGALGLVAGSFASQFLISAFQVGQIIKTSTNNVLAESASRIKESFKKYRRFPLYQVPATLFETLTSYLPLLTLAPQFGAKSAGFFFLAQSVIRVPVIFLSKAVGDVFRQKASRQFSATGQCREEFLNTFRMTSLVAVPLFAALGLLGPTIFALVFGEEWRESGEYARLMCLMFAFQFVASPLSAIFTIAEKLAHDMAFQILTFVSVSVAFAVGTFVFNDAKITVLLYSAVYSLRYAFQIYYAHQYSRGS